MGLSIRTEQEGSTTILQPKGLLREDAAIHFIQLISPEIAKGKLQYILDLSKQHYIPPPGLYVLVELLKFLREKGGDLRLANAPQKISQVLKENGLEKQFKIYPSKKSALASYQNGSRKIRLPMLKGDIGLGDLVKRVTTAFGIKPCDGCEQRAQSLNQMLTFSGKDAKQTEQRSIFDDYLDH